MNRNSRNYSLRNRLMYYASVTVLLSALAGLSWAGNDPWKTKPFQQWDDKDIARILTDSPWAHRVAIEAAWKPMEAKEPDAAEAPPAANTGGGGKMSPASPPQSAPDTGDEAGGEARPEAQFLVFWMSSKTMRAALARRAVLHNGKTEADAEQYVNVPQEEYQVLVEGKDMTPFRQNDEKYFQSHAFLQLKKLGQKVSPSQVTLERGPDGKTVSAALFYFPKKAASGEPLIGPQEKSVEFSCILGNTTLKAAFNLQKMMNQNGEDL